MKIAAAATSHLLLLSLSPMVLIRPDTLVDAAPMSDNVVASYFEPYPDCNVDTSNIPWYARHPGDGACAYELNIPECGFDGGDCDEFNEEWPDCKPIIGKPMNTHPVALFGSSGVFKYWGDLDGKMQFWYEMLNNTECDPFLNTEGCGYDGGDCIEFNENYPECEATLPGFVGDGYCDINPFFRDKSFDTEECGFDGGDCVEVATDEDEESTIEPTPTIEPTEESTSDGTGLASEEVSEPWDEEMRAKYPNCTAIDATKIGNGRCDGAYMTEECGWDGDDCVVLHELYPDCTPVQTTAQWETLESMFNIHQYWPYILKDGECDSILNTPDCGFDDGDCLEFNEKYPGCDYAFPFAIGDGYCACLEEDPFEYTEECGWDGGDCEGLEELCEGTIEPSPTEEPPADDTEEAFSNPSGGTTTKSFQGLVWVILALAYAIGI